MRFEITTASVDEMATFTEWAEREQWNPGRSDALPFHCADPRGFLLGKLAGTPVASVSAVRYGADHGFLGFYIAHPSVRGQGYGIQLWRAAMERLAGRNVGLDGVVEQQENYRRSGFRRAWTHVRYEGVPAAERPPADITLVDARAVPFGLLAAYDRRFFPADRDAFLASWLSTPGHTSVAAVRDGELRGLAVMRPARAGSRIGPLYAASEEIALALVHALAATAPGTSVALDIPDVNALSVKLAERLGLRPTFECARMYTAPAPTIDLAAIYATTTIELG
ncbi:GNAT family N-acetyltransferase [Streptomyces sp. NBC_01190]|uniref:GNAT family N-acetyltransferase n=1 Tax=Streptomyces sp. NBC_01190 TaxID=2903767 RepID=UPI00386CEC75|nr:GNAT family N-acetyltransferase [Streptomyces sp. NBC_01190]